MWFIPGITEFLEKNWYWKDEVFPDPGRNLECSGHKEKTGMKVRIFSFMRTEAWGVVWGAGGWPRGSLIS